jgi:hypothetical protein
MHLSSLLAFHMEQGAILLCELIFMNMSLVPRMIFPH